MTCCGGGFPGGSQPQISQSPHNCQKTLSQVILSHHWKTPTEYAKTKHILPVQKLYIHKNLNSTLSYTQLIALPQNEEYICNVAKNVEGAKDLIEAGFEYVTDVNDCKLFRKMKTSYSGSQSLQKGPWSRLD